MRGVRTVNQVLPLGTRSKAFLQAVRCALAFKFLLFALERPGANGSSVQVFGTAAGSPCSSLWSFVALCQANLLT